MRREIYSRGSKTDDPKSIGSSSDEPARRFLEEAKIPDGAFLVGEWLVEPALCSLTRFKKTVRIEPKIMDLLVYLAQHAGKVVAKERLMAVLWADVFVTDDVLTRGVSELRRVFGDSWQKPRFIQTIPRRGYRLIAAVTHAGNNPTSMAKRSNTSLSGVMQFFLQHWKAWPLFMVAAGARLAAICGLLRGN